MKKRAIGLVIFLGLLAGCANPRIAGTAGNTGGNLCAGGTVVADEEFVVSSFGTDVVKSGPEGEDKVVLAEGDSALYLNLTEDGWIYYVNTSDNYNVYRIDMDGENRTRISEDTARFLNVAGDRMFYTSEEDDMKLVTGKTDGTEKKVLEEKPCVNVVWSEGWIYYLTLEDGQLWRTNADGSKKQQVTEEKVVQFDVEGEEIYFVAAEGDSRRIMKTTAGKTPEELLAADCSKLNVKDGLIYFQTGDAEGIRVLNPEDSSVEVLSETDSMAVQITGERIYYREKDGTKAVCSMKTDGTNEKAF